MSRNENNKCWCRLNESFIVKKIPYDSEISDTFGNAAL